jgi:hypothetical protein
MKKLIIPRKDHEVYFLLKPETVKNNKQLQLYVTDKMEKMHPAFSVKSKTDIKQIGMDNTLDSSVQWLIITVMEEDILTEYRLLNNHSIFFLYFSIMVNKKDFIHNGMHTIDDEIIGFDSEKKEPVSIPLETKENNEEQKLMDELENIPMRHAVFRKKLPVWIMPAAGICFLAIIMLLTASFNNNSGNNANKATKDISYQSQTLNKTETSKLKETIPSPIEILSSMSADVVDLEGTILQWQCNTDIDPFMIIQLQGIDVLNVYHLFSQYKYTQLQDIQEIRYGDNEPYITIFLNADKSEYASLPIMAFPAHDVTFPVITELSGILKDNDIFIMSETLPAAANGYLAYSINFSATDLNLISSLEIITAICNNYKLQVKNLDINISNKRFHVNCTLSYCNDENFPNIALGNDKYYIPLAFGYSWENPAVEYSTLDVIEYEKPIIGSIMDDSGKRTFFRDTADGKIQVRVER